MDINALQDFISNQSEEDRKEFMLNYRIESFKKGDFDFIVKSIAKNNEGSFIKGQEATHEKQKKALEILTSNKYDQFLYGGAAGGAKSWTGVSWIVLSCLAYPNTKWFIARNELKDLKSSVMETFKKVCREYDITDYKFNSVDMFIRFPNGSHINLIEVKYKPSDPLYEDIGSTEYTGGWVEEIGEIHPKAVNTLDTRTGRHMNEEYGLNSIIYLTCNPKQNWAKTDFYDKHINGSLYEDNKDKDKLKRIYLECLVVENPFIEQAYIDKLRKQASNDNSMFQRLFKGNWDYEDNPYQLTEQEMIEGVFENYEVQGGKTYLTADIARYGADKAVFIAWDGWIAKEIISLSKSSLQDTTNAINSLRRKYRIPKTRCIADGDGVGGFAIDATGIKSFKNGGSVIKVNKETPNYKNLQVQCLYNLADVVNEGRLHIEVDGIYSDDKKENSKDIQRYIMEELAQIQSVPNRRDSDKLDCKIKSDIKQDLGRSPDYRDALLMRVWFDLKPAKRAMISSRKRSLF